MAEPLPNPDPWSAPDVWAERDADGVLRHLRHLAAPIRYDPDKSDREVALEYLTLHAAPEAYGLSVAQLRLLENRCSDPATPPPEEGYWYKWLSIRRLPARDGGTAALSAVVLQQTRAFWHDGTLQEVEVRDAGLRVVVRRRRVVNAAGVSEDRAEVTSSNSTAERPSDVRAPIFGASVAFLDPERGEAIVNMVLEVMGRPGTAIRRPPFRVTPVVRRSAPAPAPRPQDQASEARAANGSSSAFVVSLEVDLMTGTEDSRRLAMWPPENSDPRQAAARDAAGPENEVGFRAIVELDGDVPRVVSVRALVASCTGTVFPLDPASDVGSLAVRPDLPAAALDPLRSEVDLDGLDPSSPQPLSGDFVQIASPGPLGINPPEKVHPFKFNYSARTDDFAAVSAYHHCHGLFAMANAFGFDETNYFFPHGQALPAGASDQFPVRVAHRAAMTLPEPNTGSLPFTDGQVFAVNAQVVPGAGAVDGVDLGTFVAEMRFALGDLADGKTTPTPWVTLAPGVDGAFGAGTDVRWCCHEFCHALLVAGTGSLELPFAHSAGDALGAILCDPDSEFARPVQGELRGRTFPSVWQPLRRHDRCASLGWGWYGTLYPPQYPDVLDPDGYVAEEILSSTLFRLYCALGGDATLGAAGPGLDEPDRPRRRAAADYVAYLIMRAIGSLGLAAAAPSTPGVFASALMCADAQTGLFVYGGQQRQGGAVRKVIRSAFQKQGLYQDPNAPYPRNGPGMPEAVDVFLEDGRSGEYQHTADWHALPEAVWVRPAGAPGGGDTWPAPGQLHHVWVRVRNRGSALAQNVVAAAYAAASADTATWRPATWPQLSLPGGGAPAAVAIPPGGFADFGPFEWTPAGPGLHAVLVAVDAQGDRSVFYPPSGLACAAGPTPVADLVPFDNNLGYRRWTLF